ncbi:AIPR family protein [Bisbaumannia pacifica]|uniref:AIPR family protein n=1 Tax=Bisbaumannia pacifica TaxID=77098 RepID=A0ABD4KWT9_9GAMM|nr:AIPR family protein [Halomonas pacifica]MBH8578749.1 AIPR family protein [Halomonas pacifica]
MSDSCNELRLSVGEYRTLPIPFDNDGGKPPKLATCFVRVDELPEWLGNWMEVNPRVPKLNKKEKLQGPVAKAMIRTLIEEPEQFALKNQGIYLLVDEAEHGKEKGGEGVLRLRLTDSSRHGLVNGGHTFKAIREAAEEENVPDPWNAYVRLHIMQGIKPEQITELAEGLNRSLQVNDPSLENLRGTFDAIKEHLAGKPGADQIAYRQGDMGDIDVQQILTYMAMLDLKNFPDRKKHPNRLFGQPKGVLNAFIEDAKDPDSSFKRMLPHIHEILVLADEIQKQGVTVDSLAKVKVANTKQQNRVRSSKHRGRPAHFAGGTIEGIFPLGWIYPMLAALRANVSRKAWDAGRFEWLIDPHELLNKTIDEMAEIVKQEHIDNNRKPAEVGRKEAAYRSCYGVATMELARHQIVAEEA